MPPHPRTRHARPRQVCTRHVWGTTLASALLLILPGLGAVPAGAAARPTIAHLADVDINLGLTQRVSAAVSGATMVEWRIWTAKTGWTLLARGSGYSTINFTGEALRHMGLVQVTAINAAGSTVSNAARLRVWGIAPDYPARAGSMVRTGGWEITVYPASQVDDPDTPGLQARVAVKKLAAPPARPVQGTEMAFRTASGVMRDVFPSACTSRSTPDYDQLPAQPVGTAAAGHVCAPGLTALVAKGGIWRVNAYPSESSTVAGPTAWFRSA